MRILIVEDEVLLAGAISRGLTAEGFTVEVTNDGSEGLRLASENEYDALILDILLPGQDGYQVCSRLREAGNWVPILMLTALEDALDEAEGLDRGADDYLTKPFSYPVLLARVRALIRRGAAERPAVLEAGDLRLDPAAHRCWRGEIELALTTREFSLLEYLLRHPGEVLAKTQILEHVWDFAYADSTNLVEVYVGYLRRKLGTPESKARIETIRGAGYRLVVGD